VARHDIVSITTRTTVAAAEQLVADTGHSRLPVFDADSGSPLGFVHAKDLLALSAAAAGLHVPLRLVRRMPLVTADRRLENLLVAMRNTGVHVALVVDAGGAGDDGTGGQVAGATGVDGVVAAGAVLGLVTLEDLLEELVGEIVDETDPHTDTATDTGPGGNPGGEPPAGSGA
jgi:CBS domain containing-hemolysin-like protein